MKNWKLTSLVGLAVLTFASAASARHGHGVYQSMKTLDKETDHLKSHYSQFMHNARIARTDRHYWDLMLAINSFEKHADHIRSNYENRRSFHEIANEVATAKRAAAQVEFLMHDHLKLPKSLDQDFHAAECALNAVAAVYSNHARHGARQGRGHQGHGHQGHGHAARSQYRVGNTHNRALEIRTGRNGFLGNRSASFQSGGLTIRFGR